MQAVYPPKPRPRESPLIEHIAKRRECHDTGAPIKTECNPTTNAFSGSESKLENIIRTMFMLGGTQVSSQCGTAM